MSNYEPAEERLNDKLQELVNEVKDLKELLRQEIERQRKTNQHSNQKET